MIYCCSQQHRKQGVGMNPSPLGSQCYLVTCRMQ